MRAFLAFALVIPAFAHASDLKQPVKLEAGGAPVDVEVGHAAPLVVDLDGDGSRELLVGQFGDGKLRIYPIGGTKTAPRLGELRWFDGTIPAT
jgi:hypothetical protein